MSSNKNKVEFLFFFIYVVCVYVYLHVEPWATGEGLQQHEEADRECTALWCARGGGCKWFQVSDGWRQSRKKD